MAVLLLLLLNLLLLLPLAFSTIDLAYPGVSSRWPASTSVILQHGDLICGFLSENSTFSKLSVYYKELGEFPTLLWSLNITMSKNATLEFGADGNLVLREADSSLLWSSNTNASRMELLMTGNLVLYDTDGINYVWQSFDSQDSFYSLVSGQSLKVGQRLADDMLEGKVYLEVQAHQVVLYDARFKSPYPYGAWNSPGQEIGSMRVERNFSVALVDPMGGAIETIDLSLECSAAEPPGFGALRLHNGELLAFCTNISFSTTSTITQLLRRFFKDFYTSTCCNPSCGGNGICRNDDCFCPQGRVGDQSVVFTPSPYAYPLACQPPDFRKSKQKKIELMELPGVDHLVNPFVPGLRDLSLDMCKKLCLENSSCNGFSFRVVDNDVLCQHADVLLLRNLSDTQANVTTFIKVELPETNLPSRLPERKVERRQNRLTMILISAMVAGMSTLIGTSVFIYSLTRKRHVTPKSEPADDHQSNIFLPTFPRRFSYEDLCQMTSNFTLKLGHGGFGSVYKGKLGQTLVAIKCLESERQGQEQFETEAMTIGRIHHKNLVKLLGFGVEKLSYYLVYELMANISLDKWLFENELGFLNWEKRFNICLDVARGMNYLHQECLPPVLHLDIKPSNILLDESFQAKICDFGLARLADGKESIKGAGWRGTPGYMAPEWLHGKVTEKSDVFSFGIVLLEIVSGRKTIQAPTCMSAKSLLRTDTFSLATDGGNVSSVIDRRLLDDGLNLEQVSQVIQVALECTSEDPSRRPSMSKVVHMLG